MQSELSEQIIAPGVQPDAEPKRPGETPDATTGLTLAQRETVRHHAADLARTVRSKGRILRALCGVSMMPAAAMAELDSARATVDGLLYYNGAELSQGGVSAQAMLQVQRIRAALDELSSCIERWRNHFPGDDFPESVLTAMQAEMARAEWLHLRAVTDGDS